MNKSVMGFVSAMFILNVPILFAGLILLLPFLAQPVQDIHPALYTHFYFYHYGVYTSVLSILLAAWLSYVLYKKKFTIKAQITLICFQLLFLIFLVVIVYFNINYLNEMLSRPAYE